MPAAVCVLHGFVQKHTRVRSSRFIAATCVDSRLMPLGTDDDPVSAAAATGSRRRQEVLAAVSDGLLALLKDFHGCGPAETSAYYEEDLVVCVFRGGFSRVEETLLASGRRKAVIDQRMAFQDTMRQRFEQVVEGATGREVLGSMSGSHQDPDMMCEIFILAQGELSEG